MKIRNKIGGNHLIGAAKHIPRYGTALSTYRGTPTHLQPPDPPETNLLRPLPIPPPTGPIATLPPIISTTPGKSRKKDTGFQASVLRLPPDGRLPLRQFEIVWGDIYTNAPKFGDGERGQVKVLRCAMTKQFFAVKIFDIENFL
jgi:hypothetical protein